MREFERSKWNVRPKERGGRDKGADTQYYIQIETESHADR